MFLVRYFLALAAVGALSACSKSPLPLTGKFPQRAYLWQREWTPAVGQGIDESKGRLDGLIVLASEVSWRNAKRLEVRPSIDWSVLRSSGIPISLAVRIEPATADAADANSAWIADLGDLVRTLLREATMNHVPVRELQIDYDCAQKNLASYHRWLPAVRPHLGGIPLVITTLPSWLDEPLFRDLIGVTDRYVLQVHSVPALDTNGRVAICDADQARRWVAKAEQLGRPFMVALPTYSCVVGYDSTGRMLGMAADSVQPTWPTGTRVRFFDTDANAMAGLVREWQKQRPAGLQEVLWYRLPVKSDRRNWSWSTLSAVMAGKTLMRGIRAHCEGGNPVDIAVENTGEIDELLDRPVVIEGVGGQLMAFDALAGWNVEASGAHAIFKPKTGVVMRLSPGKKRNIGWLRYDQRPNLHAHITD